jgi:putative ABC transport system permease protein
MFSLSFKLAWRDYCHERMLSLCSILALLAVLTPLLVLGGVRFGITNSLTDNLLRDPRNLEIIPAGSGHYPLSWFEHIKDKSEVAFIIPQTRSIAATMDLYYSVSKRSQIVELIPSSAGDPLLERWSIEPPPEDIGPAGEAAEAVPVVLSNTAARLLEAKEGAALEGRVERVYQNARERVSLPFVVTAVLPPEAQQKSAAYVAFDLLAALEDYRDGREVSVFAWSGEPKPEAEPLFAAFRLYAVSLDEVKPLADYLTEKEMIQVTTHAAEIEMVKNMDRSFLIVFCLIAAAAVFGFTAAILSSAVAGVKRKSRSLALLRLMGFPSRLIILFPVWQSALTGFFGYILSCLIYGLLSSVINTLFAGVLQEGQSVCRLLPAHFLLAAGLTLGLCALASLWAARQAARIDPAEVIREV